MKLLLMVYLAACGPTPSGQVRVDEDTGPGVSDTGQTVEATPDPAHWVVGQSGSLVVIRTGAAPHVSRGVRAYGLFAPDLEPVAGTAAAWCMTGGPCADSWPTAPGPFALRPRPEGLGLVSSWVGDAIVMDRLQPTYAFDERTGLGFYRDVRGGSLGVTDLEFTFEHRGEWGPFDGLIQVPAAMEITSPQIGSRVDLSADTVAFRWTPGGPGQVYLRVHGRSETDQMHVLDDDGEHDFDLRGAGLTDASRVALSLGRYLESGPVDVNGNSLSIVGASEQRFDRVCGAYPEIAAPDAGWPGQFDPGIGLPYGFSMSFTGMVDGGMLHDYFRGAKEAPTSAELRVDVYDEMFDVLCSLHYDASQVSPAPPVLQRLDFQKLLAFDVDAYGTWELQLSEGVNSCGPAELTATIRSPDLRDYFIDTPWRLQFGPPSELMGGDYSLYLSPDGTTAYELEKLTAYRVSTCDVVESPAVVLDSRPDHATGVQPGYYESYNPGRILLF